MSEFNFQKYLKTYTNRIILPGSKEEIEIRPLTTNDMKKLLVYENEKDPLVGEKVLDQIINDAVISEDFNIEDLLLQDRYFIFIELRKLTKGSTYNFTYTCKNCKNQSLQTIDLDTIKVIQKEDYQKELSLMDGNIKLEMGYVTRKEQKEAYSIIDKNLKQTQKQVEMILSDIACSIKSISTKEGKEEIPIKVKMELIGNLPGKEYDKIKDWYTENNFGFDFNVEIICPHCGHTENIDVPLDNFFV
jgi:hypothetical protein